MSEFGRLQKHENIQHAPILGYEARNCCCWPAEGNPNFTARAVTIWERKAKKKTTTNKRTNAVFRMNLKTEVQRV